MWNAQLQPPFSQMAHSSHAVFSPPMSEETVEKTSQRIQSSIRDLGIISRELLKGSRSEEALISTAKQFAHHESQIESCVLNISKLEILSQQLSLHEECMEQALSNVEDLDWKLNRILGRINQTPAITEIRNESSMPPSDSEK